MGLWFGFAGCSFQLKKSHWKAAPAKAEPKHRAAACNHIKDTEMWEPPGQALWKLHVLQDKRLRTKLSLQVTGIDVEQ